MLALDALRGKWKTAVLTGIAASALGATIVKMCIRDRTTTTTFSRKADLRTDYFRHRNAEKYSCLPLPIFLNNTRNALVV